MAEELIEAVRSQRVLYDTNHPDYMKSKLKDDIWNTIASCLEYRNGSEAKDAWLKLRNCHRDALRRQTRFKGISGSRGLIMKKWKYQQQMEFLMPYMAQREANYNMVDDGSFTQSPMEENNVATTADYVQCETMLSCEDNLGNPEQYSSIKEERLSNLSQETKRRRALALRKKKSEIGTLLHQTLERHELKSQERARMLEDKLYNERRDPVYHFFMSMYAMTAKMSPATQHMVKKEVFKIVSGAEEAMLSNVPTNMGYIEKTDPSYTA